MRERSKMQTLGLGMAAGMLSALALNACGETAAGGDGQCVSNEDFFKERVWTNVLSTTCIKCHTDTGQAKDSNFILRDAKWGPDYLENNLVVFESLAKLEYEGTPWILLKPTQDKGVVHGGLQQLDKGSQEYKDFQEMIERLADPVSCNDDDGDADQFFDGVQLL